MIAVAACLTLVAACGSETETPDGDGPTQTEGSTSAPGGSGSLEGVTVEVDEDEGPAFLWDGEPFADGGLPFEATATEVSEITAGSGDPAGQDHQVTARYSLLNGRTGEVALSTFDADVTETFSLADGAMPPGLLAAIEGATEGSSRLVAIPGPELFPQGAPEFGVEPGDTLLMYLEFVAVQVPLTEAEGTPVDPVEGLPEVSFESPGPAEVTIPEGVEPPEEMVVQLLIEGDGPVTEPGQSVSVHYTGVSWETGEMFDNSWERGAPFPVSPLGQAQVISGWNEGLQDLPVGSRVMLVLPPDMAYGEEGHALSGQTLVFVVDILAAG